MKARIFQPAKTAMQSGWGKTHRWVLEYEPTGRRHLDPLMGWTGGGDTRQQVRLEFDSEGEAVAFAERHRIEYNVHRPKDRDLQPKAYADNFAYDRKFPWSH